MNTLPALSVSDLQVLDHEPRVQDLRLAESLGFERPRKIREIIERNRPELETFGTCPTVGHVVRGNPVTEYWLSEPQALLICMFSRTERAREARRQLIEVFLAWRQGRLVPADPFEAMARRLEAVERQIAFQREMVAEPLAGTLSYLPIWSNGRRPGFWGDPPVRALLTTLHRQVTIDAAVRLCTDRFGPDRTPARSAVHRYWMKLDQVRGNGGTT